MNIQYAPPVTPPVLSIKHLSKQFGARRILTDISLDIPSGEIFGFLGPNGSGKTTTIKLMLGLLNIDSGEISICGHDVKNDFEAAMSCVGGIIENPEMYKYLSGKENLELYRRMYDNVPRERIDELIKLVRLEARADDKIAKYSLGMRQRLGVAQALLNRPRLLVLDEPTNGLDPAGIKELRDILKELSHKENVAVFVSSHQLAELDLMCDRVGILDRGVLLRTMSIEEVRRAGSGNRDVIEIVIPEAQNGAAAVAAGTLGEDVTVETVNGKLHVTLGSGKTPELVRALVAGGCDISSVTPVTHSLEDVFLEATKIYTPAGGGGSAGYARRCPSRHPTRQKRRRRKQNERIRTSYRQRKQKGRKADRPLRYTYNHCGADRAFPRSSDL